MRSNNRFAERGNPHLRSDWRDVMDLNLSAAYKSADMPAGVTKGVPKTVFEQAAAGIVRFCVDAAIFTLTPDGWRVVLSRRSLEGTFPGVWWINGGGNFAYVDSRTFLKEKVQKETGCSVQLGPLVASAMTSCHVKPCSTFQECYFAVVDWDEYQLHARSDGDHSAIRLFSLEEYSDLPLNQKHWYIEGVVLACFRTLQT